MQPIGHLTRQPFSRPSKHSTFQPSKQPTKKPSNQPSSRLSNQPTSQTTFLSSNQILVNPSNEPHFSQLASRQLNRFVVLRKTFATTYQTTHLYSLQYCQPNNRLLDQLFVRLIKRCVNQICHLYYHQESSHLPSLRNSPFGIHCSLLTRAPSTQPLEKPTINPSVQPTIIPSYCQTSQPPISHKTAPGLANHLFRRLMSTVISSNDSIISTAYR